MVSTLRRSSRRRAVIGATTAVAVLGVIPAISIAGPSLSHSGSCPAAESLVPATTWTTKTLAKGVTMTAGVRKDSKGEVSMHVLRVDLTQRTTRVIPLVHSLAQRLPLSTLAAHQPHLVAATNTGYFDFGTGAPTQPLILGGVPQVISSVHEPVVGFGANGRLEAGNVWLSSTLSAAGSSRGLVALNEAYPPSGLGLYNQRWGSARVPGGWSRDTRGVVNGAVTSVQFGQRGAVVPSDGYLLQGRGKSSADWLDNLSSGTTVALASAVKTDAKSPFVQAYGVGLQLVAKRGVAETGFGCSSANTKQPARTAIGWTNGGRTMIIAIVSDHPHTSLHGLDNDQMSKLMAQLGVQQAYDLDGSGSTEMLAKFKNSSSLKIQNYPADGSERPMPVGLGISVTPAKHHHH